jgi:transcriptional regulator with XRE-family HTH domain
MASHAKSARFSPTEKLVVYGGAAATIRAAMEQKDLEPGDLNEALGRRRGDASIYNYINGNSAPSDKIRPKLAKVLGVPESALRRAKLEDGRQAGVETAIALARLQAPANGRLPDVLTFTLAADGTARLRLDYTAPAERGIALLRLLLDAGLAITAAAE